MSPINRHQLSPNQKRSGVFISYARSDGSEFANQLRQLLERQNIPLWQDRVAMEGGRDWWQQITEALDKVSFLLLVVTPNALNSKIVRDEWRYARQQGVCVYPIKGSPDIDYKSMPRWMRDAAFYNLGTLEDGDLSPEWRKFLNDLNKTPDVRRVPFMVEDLPANHVHRSEEFDKLIALLLDRTREEPVAITAALRGAGGYGKTTIAKSLCHNEDIQDSFDDGILWVTLGENPGDLTGRVEDLIQTISGERPGFSNLEAAITRFTELLADRDILLVIDDVWNRDHLRPFLQGGRRCARLITTRNLDTLPPQAQQVKVDAMNTTEAVKMLCTGLPNGEVADYNRDLTALAVRLGEWPLLLGLVGAALQDRVQNTNQSLPEAISYVNRALDKRGLTFFDSRDTESRNQAVAKTIGVSLELLTANERSRYNELALFPEDVNIPLSTLGKFWASTGAANGFDAEFDTEELCTRLNRLSLLYTFDAKARYIRLHDMIRQYLMHQQRDRLPELHSQLLNAHRRGSTWSALPDEEPYFWDHLALHLVEAKREQELVATVKDWRYLAKKSFLRKSHAVDTDLLKALAIAPADDLLRTLWRSFANTGHLFNRCSTLHDLEATLFSRLQHLSDLGALLQDLAQHLAHPHITPKFDLPDLPHPALIRTLEGHSSVVQSCVFSPDGKLIVSASGDQTLRVWEAATGAMLRTLKGHSKSVNACGFSPDGQLIVSASTDRTLKVWDLAAGAVLHTLKGHSSRVTGCAFSPDGKLIVSASNDDTLKVWQAATGAMMYTLKGHSLGVTGCAFSPDGKLIVSASGDQTLRVWEAATGAMLRILKGHSKSVNACGFSPDGQLIVSASNDNTLKVWDAGTGAMLRTLLDHSSEVKGYAFSPDGKLLASASYDNTLKVWEATGAIQHTLEGHSKSVNGCGFSFDRKLIVSASSDRTLKIWEAVIGQMPRRLRGYSHNVKDCAFSPDGKFVVSASTNHTLHIWEAATGTLLHTLAVSQFGTIGYAFSPDGKLIVSASTNGAPCIWEVATGTLLHTLGGLKYGANGCAFSPDGKLIVVAFQDGTLQIWEVATGILLHTLRGLNYGVRDCAFSPDGKLIISASHFGGTLEIWDMATEVRTLSVHQFWVSNYAFSPDGKLIILASRDGILKILEVGTWALRPLEGYSLNVKDWAFSPDGGLIASTSWDGTLKVWDAATGTLWGMLEGHSHNVKGCAFSLDGKLIISASGDGTLKVWDVATGQSLATFLADWPLTCCTIFEETIVAGGLSGVYFLHLER